MIGVALYFTFAPEGSDSPWFTPAQKILGMIGGSLAVKTFWTIMGTGHTLESIYTFILCKRHTSFIVGVSRLLHHFANVTNDSILQAEYVLATLIFGFPIVLDLRRRIQEARIESVMKVE